MSDVSKEETGEAPATPEPTGHTPPPAKQAPPVRWWPAVLVGVAAASVITVLWARGDLNHQRRNLGTAITLALSGGLMGIWLLFLSRMRWRTRFAIIGVLAASAGLVCALFQMHGVTGDLVPILEFRWTKHPLALASSPVVGQPPVSAAVSRVPGDYPQFLGPNRNGALPGPVIATDWQAHAPTLVWRKPLGPAWSGFAVVGNIAVTQEQRGESEAVVAYDLPSGRELWVHTDAVRYFTTLGGEGPRATPTIANGRVYTLGALGDLDCLDLTNGTLAWRKSLQTEFQAKPPEWGFASSPLVWSNLVVVAVGGKGHSLAAFKTTDGSIAWAAGDASAGYGSPALVELLGVPQILIFNGAGVTSHNPEQGTVLWHRDWPRSHPHVAAPVVVSTNRVLISSGYGTGAALIEIKRNPAGAWETAELWKTIRLKAKFNNPVTRAGYAYGLDDGILCCLDLASGKQMWKGERLGHGQNLLVAATMLVSTEDGFLTHYEPDPAAPKELGRFRVFNRKTWNPFAVAGDYVLMRTDVEAACIRLPVTAASHPNPASPK